MAETSTATIARDQMIVGLRNAHALENQAVEQLERQIERLVDYPEMQARLRRHLDETRAQRDRLEKCLGRLGESESTLKDLAMKFAGNLQPMMHMMAGDEVLKNTFASSAFEHFEIASYKSLIVMAKTAGDAQTAEVCQQNLSEEVAMADWIDQNVETVTQRYLALSASGETAKR
jgi:ferritin-like metal-binding protein YciE